MIYDNIVIANCANKPYLSNKAPILGFIFSEIFFLDKKK
jgi:hypothetical protein